MSVIVGSPNNLGQNFRQPDVPTQIARSSDTYKNSTTSAKTNFEWKYLTTPIPSGKMKCWGCSFDAERSPLHKLSPNPKRRAGEEDKPTRTNMIEQIITTTSTWDTKIYQEVWQLHKGAPTSSLLRWPQRSESLPPHCLSQSNHKGYLSFPLTTKNVPSYDIYGMTYD